MTGRAQVKCMLLIYLDESSNVDRYAPGWYAGRLDDARIGASRQRP